MNALEKFRIISSVEFKSGICSNSILCAKTTGEFKKNVQIQQFWNFVNKVRRNIDTFLVEKHFWPFQAKFDPGQISLI
jgi:hypothetical protein